MSQIRQNYHEECEAIINKQINMHLYSSYVYLSMCAYFDRDDIALPGICEFISRRSKEENEAAYKFIEYQNTRGGKIHLQTIPSPSVQQWPSSLSALNDALNLEKEVNQCLLTIHNLAEEHSDGHLSEYLEEEIVKRTQTVETIGNKITQLQRAGTSGLGEYTFDRDLKD